MGTRLVGVRRSYLRGCRLGEEDSLQRGGNRFVRRCRVMEIKEVMEIVSRSRVGKAEIAEAKDSLDSLQDAAKIVFQVADIADLGRIGRNHQQWHAKAELIIGLVGAGLEHRSHVVVPTSPIVPGNEYGGVLPVAGTVVASRVISDGIDKGRHPRRPLAAVDRMVRILSGGSDPTYLGESAVGDVVQGIGWCSVDVAVGLALRPFRPRANAAQRYADFRERVWRHPETALAFGIVGPGNFRTVQTKQVIHGIAGEALHGFVARRFRAKWWRPAPAWSDQLDRFSRTTAIIDTGTVLGDKDTYCVVRRGRCRSSSKNKLMGRITRALVGLKHPVAPSIRGC